MKKFYIVFYEHKHGVDYSFYNELKLAIDEANKITKENHSDEANHYKEVSEDCTNSNIYIRSLSLENESITTKDLDQIFYYMNVNINLMPIEDNELNMEKYPNLQEMIIKHNLKLEIGKINYGEAYCLKDNSNGNCVRFSTEFNNKNNVLSSKTAIQYEPRYATRSFFSHPIINQYDVNKTIKPLEEWASKIKDIEFKKTIITQGNEETTVFYE